VLKKDQPWKYQDWTRDASLTCLFASESYHWSSPRLAIIRLKIASSSLFSESRLRFLFCDDSEQDLSWGELPPECRSSQFLELGSRHLSSCNFLVLFAVPWNWSVNQDWWKLNFFVAKMVSFQMVSLSSSEVPCSTRSLGGRGDRRVLCWW